MNKLRFWCGFFWGLTLGLTILTLKQFYHPPLNPGECGTNCMGCTIAFDLSERGIPCKARNFEPAALGVSSVIKTIYPDLDEQDIDGNAYQTLKNALLRGGERGLLRYQRKDETRHMVAYLVRSGRVFVMDAQSYGFAIPLRVFLWMDRGETYSWARLDNIEFNDCELLDRLVERSGQ